MRTPAADRLCARRRCLGAESSYPLRAAGFRRRARQTGSRAGSASRRCNGGRWRTVAPRGSVETPRPAGKRPEHRATVHRASPSIARPAASPRRSPRPSRRSRSSAQTTCARWRNRPHGSRSGPAWTPSAHLRGWLSPRGVSRSMKRWLGSTSRGTSAGFITLSAAAFSWASVTLRPSSSARRRITSAGAARSASKSTLTVVVPASAWSRAAIRCAVDSARSCSSLPPSESVQRRDHVRYRSVHHYRHNRAAGFTDEIHRNAEKWVLDARPAARNAGGTAMTVGPTAKLRLERTSIHLQLSARFGEGPYA